jgi:hypothetical protein
MSAREQLLKMQRIILRQLKESVHKLQGESPPEIARYYQAYKREFRNYQKISNKNELLRSARKADIIFGADFHPFAQSQRTHLRILRELNKNQRPLILALEAIDSHHNNIVSDYLKGRIDDKTFLKKIDYFESWGFPWENYKVLFEFARSNNISIYGINRIKLDGKKDDLNLRDAHAAKEISSLRQKNPEALIYVLYGDLHLASNHLPKLTKKFLGNKDETQFLTVFQNSESLYWRLAKKKLEERVDVLKLRGDAYCVVNSPPWLKWQAYLDFLEKTEDREEVSNDYTDHIVQFLKLIQGVWGTSVSTSDFHIYSDGDIRFAQALSKKIKTKDFAKVMGLVRQEKSFFISIPSLFYLHTFDVNHVATLAGQYIHGKLRRESGLHYNFPQDFVSQVWIEAVGFFASKIVNSRRKFSTYKDLSSHQQATIIALEQRLHEQMSLKTGKPLRKVRRHFSRRTNDYSEAAKIVGAILGNKIYVLFHKNKLNKDTLHRWLKRKVCADEKFLRFYMSVLSELRQVTVDEGSKNERL